MANVYRSMMQLSDSMRLIQSHKSGCNSDRKWCYSIDSSYWLSRPLLRIWTNLRLAL